MHVTDVTDWMKTFEGDIIWQSRVMLRDMRLKHDKNSAFTVPFFLPLLPPSKSGVALISENVPVKTFGISQEPPNLESRYQHHRNLAQPRRQHQWRIDENMYIYIVCIFVFFLFPCHKLVYNSMI